MFTAGLLALALGLGTAPQEDAEALYVEGVQRYNAGDYEEAVRLLSRAAALASTVPDYRFHLGLAYLKVGEPREAAREMEAALGMMGMRRATRVKEPVVLVQAAIAYLQQGDLKTAEARARLALDRGEPSPDAHYVLSLVAAERGDEAAALEHLSAVVELNRDHVEANVALANRFVAEGRIDEAREALRHATHGDPGNSGVVLSLGELALRAGDLDEAEEAFSLVLRLRPDDPRASFGLGTVLLERERYPEAIELLVTIAASSDEAAFNLAQAYAGMDRMEEARATLISLVERSPDFPRARFALALVLESAGDAESAERLYRESLEASPGFAPAALNLAALLETSGRESEALAILKTMLERALGDAERARVEEAVALLERKTSSR